MGRGASDIELEHYFHAEEGATASDGDCSLTVGAGVYHYDPQGEELLLEYDGGSRLVLTRQVPAEGE